MLTWRRFWHAWVHSFLQGAREKQERETFQIWLVGLQTKPKEAQRLWQQLQAQNAQAESRMLVALHNNLPRSVRPLLGLQNMAQAVGKGVTALQYWDDLIEQTPPHSRQRAFMEAGKAAALAKRQRLQ